MECVTRGLFIGIAPEGVQRSWLLAIFICGMNLLSVPRGWDIQQRWRLGHVVFQRNYIEIPLEFWRELMALILAGSLPVACFENISSGTQK